MPLSTIIKEKDSFKNDLVANAKSKKDHASRNFIPLLKTTTDDGDETSTTSNNLLQVPNKESPVKK